MGRRGRSVARRVLATLFALGLATLLPASVVAHPLGNFTINHYAAIRVESGRILLDVVIDQAEIPTFQARFDFDMDGDASLSDEEIETGRVTACEGIAGSLTLTAGGQALTPRLSAAGLSFPLGVGGLSTMREVCIFDAPLSTAIDHDGVDIRFADRSFAGRSGWREIVAQGSGVTLTARDGPLRQASLSDRLTRYPEDRIATPLADTMVELHATAGGPTLPPPDVPDATAVAAVVAAPSAAASAAAAPSPAPSPEPTTLAVPSRAAVPGGIAATDLPDIFRQTDLTPLVIVLSLAAAAGLGAGHALTPGHGKTLMAAYLVGTRGSARHAFGLGATVSLSHTIGILALAAVVLVANDVVAADVVVRWAPLVAAGSIVLIGGWMLRGEVRRRRTGIVWGGAHPHPHPNGRRHPNDHAHPLEGGAHTHPHPHPDPLGRASTITWRSLFVLGLAGGLIPSTSALIILLGAIAAGRPAFGLVLVVAFGIGMAAVMSGIGLVLVTARDRVDRMQAGIGFSRVRDAVPLVASVVVVGFGVVLTGQALSALSVVG
jgi:ABC-type nickel/cobalt efflux system permease component RcnA